MKKINISIRTDELDEEIVKRLDEEAKKKNRSKFIKECIKKSVHDEHIINKMNNLESQILEIKSILLNGNYNIPQAKTEKVEYQEIGKKNIENEQDLKSLEQDLLNTINL